MSGATKSSPTLFQSLPCVLASDGADGEAPQTPTPQSSHKLPCRLPETNLFPLSPVLEHPSLSDTYIKIASITVNHKDLDTSPTLPRRRSTWSAEEDTNMSTISVISEDEEDDSALLGGKTLKVIEGTNANKDRTPNRPRRRRTVDKTEMCRRFSEEGDEKTAARNEILRSCKTLNVSTLSLLTLEDDHVDEAPHRPIRRGTWIGTPPEEEQAKDAAPNRPCRRQSKTRL
jgi:hypothetical protein